MYPRRRQRRSNKPIKRAGSKGFPEGLNTLAHPSTLKDTELVELINGIYSQYGTISKRQGSLVIGQAAEGATCISQLKGTYNVGGETRFIRISDSGVPEYMNFSTNTWVPLSGTAPAGYVGTTPTFTDGVPTFATDSTTWVVQLHSRIYFSNLTDNLCYLDEDGKWNVYEELADPVAYPTVAKTGSATGSTRWFYQYVWYNDVGGTIASPGADAAVQASGTGWIGSMPRTLDTSTYLTVTLPTAPAGATKTAIFRSNLQGEAFFLDYVDASQTTFVDKGELDSDTFAPFPTDNTTKGYHFHLLDTYRGSMVGVTEELGQDTLVWSGFAEKYGSFGIPDGSGFFEYHKGDGFTINAIKSHVASNEDYLFVFKDNCFGRFQFLTSDEFEGGRIQDVNISVGSISPLSPHAAGNNLRFWSPDGAASVGNEAQYGNILRYSVLSLRADSIVQQVTQANIGKVCAEYYKHLSLFGISTDVIGGENNAILAYDERYNAWSLWSGMYPKVFAKFINPTDKIERLYYGSSLDANVLEMFNGKTDYRTSSGSGNRITLSIGTKQYDGGFPDQFKQFDRVVLVFGSLTGNNTTVGLIKATQNGVESDPRLRIAQDSVLSGFGMDEWGYQEFGMMTDESAGSSINIRYVDMRQKDLLWAKLNIQNDGIDDEVSIIGIYFYYSESRRQLPFTYKLKTLANKQQSQRLV